MPLKPLGLVALLVAPLALQAQDAHNQTFEVASVRPQSGVAGGGSSTGTRFYRPGSTLRQVIQFAYDLSRVRLEGGPEWIGTEFWAIDARSLSPATADEMRVMVKGLLADRFQLKTRVESRELPVFDLRVTRQDGTLGPNATPPNCTRIGARSFESLREAGEIACGPAGTVGYRLDGTSYHRLYGVTMSELSRYLEPITGRVVRDRTGVTGAFDIDLIFAGDVGRLRGAPPAPLPDAVPLPTALAEQLGLRLESATGSVGVLVIESVSRPTPN